MDEFYWEEKYNSQNIPWDMGYSSPPLTAYLQQVHHKNLDILLPGAGNSYESEWLWKNSFKNTWVVDIAQKPLANFQKRCPDFPSEQLLHQDFFQLQQKFDLIVEQTFFCALPPAMRPQYVKKMASLLRPGGKLLGLLFNFPLTDSGPPFGGSIEEYLSLFNQDFKIHKMENCYNSIKPRQGNELFFSLIKS